MDNQSSTKQFQVGEPFQEGNYFVFPIIDTASFEVVLKIPYDEMQVYILWLDDYYFPFPLDKDFYNLYVKYMKISFYANSPIENLGHAKAIVEYWQTLKR
ncbi:MAG TPA: hypothetical protein DIW23_04820 [Anaerolineae bacterium]|nr:hypothetical protein [Anaerolineae bacterium]